MLSAPTMSVVPKWHGVHIIVPNPVEYEPSAHAVQGIRPVFEYLPGKHISVRIVGFYKKIICVSWLSEIAQSDALTFHDHSDGYYVSGILPVCKAVSA